MLTHLVVTAYAVNDRGETYGSYLDRNAVGYAPDLVKAKGLHDRYGYLRLEDYAPELDSVEELVRWQTQVDRDNLIPLYDLLPISRTFLPQVCCKFPSILYKPLI